MMSGWDKQQLQQQQPDPARTVCNNMPDDSMALVNLEAANASASKQGCVHRDLGSAQRVATLLQLMADDLAVTAEYCSDCSFCHYCLRQAGGAWTTATRMGSGAICAEGCA
jgi:hypothetical protein